jgi:hypothetical protein
MIAALHRQYVADNVMEHGINFLCEEIDAEINLPGS